MYKVFVWICLFLIYSFLGWLVESLYCFFLSKKFVNRGFLIGPVCPIYGSGCLLILIFLSKYSEDPFTLFCMSIIICSILEYLTSYVMEKIFKTRWWDYSEKKFNLNGRICLENMIMFGLLAIVIVYLINPPIVSLVHLIDPMLLKIVVSILLVIFIIDLLISTKIIYNITGVGASVLKDSTGEITAKVKEVLSKKGLFTRRLANAFPNFKMKNVFKKKKN